MYSEIERHNTLDKLVEICKSIDDVSGVILVGSGAEGFTDKWSDISRSLINSFNLYFNLVKASC